MTPNELDRILSETDDNTVVCLYFTASWCRACKDIEPLVQSYVNKYGHLQVYKIDTAASKKLLDVYSVKKLPTFIFLKQAQYKDRIEGGNPQNVADGFIKNMR